MNFIKKCQKNWKFIFIICYPVSLLAIPVCFNSPAGYYIYSLSLIAGLWLTEAIPSPITGFIPIFLHPLLGIQNSSDIVKEYMKDSSLVFLGGFLLSSAFEYCGLHKRIALKVMIWSGTSLTTLLLGIMLTTMFLSMWMFNSAAAAMMVPIVLTVLDELENFDTTTRKRISCITIENIELKNIQPARVDTLDNENSEISRSSSLKNNKITTLVKMQKLRTLFLLGICYSANLGGTGVLTGTGANLIALDYLGSLDPLKHGDYASLTFTTWIGFAIVPMILNVLSAWLYLQIIFLGIPEKLKFWKKKISSNTLSTESTFQQSNSHIEAKIRETLERKYISLGSISTHEIAVTVHFLASITLWIFHNPKIIPGWSQLFQRKVHIATGTLFMGVLLFVIPRNKEFYVGLRTGKFSNVNTSGLLDWRFAEKRIPWGVFTLLGGGHALSKAAKLTGVATMLGNSLYTFATLPLYWIQLSLLLIIVFLTEIVSNSAVATLAIPILLDLSNRLEIHPLYLTFPSTIACSYAFMLPVATGPNAIVYSASDIKLSDMVKVGFFMNIISVIILYISINFYGNLIFHFSDYIPRK